METMISEGGGVHSMAKSEIVEEGTQKYTRNKFTEVMKVSMREF